MQPLQTTAHTDPSCYFRRQLATSISDLNTLVSEAHSNATHHLILAVRRSDSHTPSGEMVPVGRETTAHQFVVQPVRYADLRAHHLSVDTIRMVYKYFVFLTRYCPALMAASTSTTEATSTVTNR